MTREKLTKIPIEEAKRTKKKVKRTARIQKKYIGYLRELSANEAGKLLIKNDNEGFAIRNRIKRAAKELGINVVVKKRGNAILFYKELKPKKIKRIK